MNICVNTAFMKHYFIGILCSKFCYKKFKLSFPEYKLGFRIFTSHWDTRERKVAQIYETQCIFTWKRQSVTCNVDPNRFYGIFILFNNTVVVKYSTAVLIEAIFTKVYFNPFNLQGELKTAWFFLPKFYCDFTEV